MESRGKTISYSYFLKKKENKEEENLLRDIERLQTESILNHDLLRTKTQALETLRKKKWRGLSCAVRQSGLTKGRK